MKLLAWRLDNVHEFEDGFNLRDMKALITITSTKFNNFIIDNLVGIQKCIEMSVSY